MANTARHILGIETSGNTCAVGIGANGVLLAELSMTRRNVHSEHLAPMIEDVLRYAGLQPAQLAAVCLSAGPGSFTGLRIGYSVAKGLAYGAHLPLIEVPSLDIWAFQHGRTPHSVVAMVDAHRGELFCARYLWDASGHLQRCSPYLRLQPSALAERFTLPYGLIGNGSEKFMDSIAASLPAECHLIRPAAAHPPVWALLSLGDKHYSAGNFANLAACEPMYLRDFQPGVPKSL